MLIFDIFLCFYCLFEEFCYINTDCRLLKFIIIDKFTIKTLKALEKCHHMPIKHIISMFEQKSTKNVEEIVLLNSYLPNLLH